jgi:hypothetical protein
MNGWMDEWGKDDLKSIQPHEVTMFRRDPHLV